MRKDKTPGVSQMVSGKSSREIWKARTKTEHFIITSDEEPVLLDDTPSLATCVYLPSCYSFSRTCTQSTDVSPAVDIMSQDTAKSFQDTLLLTCPVS